jgi:hypothetical protein
VGEFASNGEGARPPGAGVMPGLPTCDCVSPLFLRRMFAAAAPDHKR